MILALGVRPDTTLAEAAGLEIGERGGIRVDDQMRTSDPDIFAVGDAIEVKDFVTGEWNLVALAGPANRQGRIAADVIAGRDSRFRGTQGTAIIGLFGGAAAWTGVSEKTLKGRGDTDYEKVYIFPNSHAGYYPGASMIGMKIIFRKSDGRLLGAQALGQDGAAVDKRISTLAMALQMGATISTSRKPSCAMHPSSAAQKIRSTSPAWLPLTCSAAICRWPIGTMKQKTPFCWMCANRWSWWWSPFPERSTFRWASCARGSVSSPLIGTSTSSAARHSVPTTRRVSCCRTV